MPKYGLGLGRLNVNRYPAELINMEIARNLENNYKEMSFSPEIIVKEKLGVDLELEKLDISEEENELISNGHDVNINIPEEVDDGDVKTMADEVQSQNKTSEENDIGEQKNKSEETEDNTDINDDTNVEGNNQVCKNEETTEAHVLQHTEETRQGCDLDNTTDNISEVECEAKDVTIEVQQNDSAEVAVRNADIEDKTDIEETSQLHDDIIEDNKIIDGENDATVLAGIEPTTPPEESYVHIEAEEGGANVPLPIDNDESINGHIEPVVEDVTAATSASCNEATILSDCHTNIPSHDDDTTSEAGGEITVESSQVPQTEHDNASQEVQGEELEEEIPITSSAPLVNGSIAVDDELAVDENITKDEDNSDSLEETKEDEIKNEPSKDQLEECVVEESVITVENTEELVPPAEIKNENEMECVSDEVDSTSTAIVDNPNKDVEIVASNWGMAGELSQSKTAGNVDENDDSLILNRNAAFLTEVPPADDEDEDVTESSKEMVEKETDEDSFVMLEKVSEENESTCKASEDVTKTDETECTDVVNDTSNEELNTGASNDKTTEERNNEFNTEELAKIHVEEDMQVTKPLLMEETPIVEEDTVVKQTTLIDPKVTSKPSKEVEKTNKKTARPEMKIPITISLPITFGVGLILYFIFGKKNKV